MATSAEYMSIIGDNRIVSFVNDDGDPVPKTLEAAIYPDFPGTPQVGNRKVVVKVRILQPDQGQGTPDDALLLKVQVPAGIIAAHVQRFDADTPQLDYYPYVKISPINTDCYVERISGSVLIGSENVADQDLDILLTNIASADNPILFYVEIDWSHTIKN